MKALVLNALHQPLTFQEVNAPVAAKGEGIVTLRAAALNHRDVFITQGLYVGIKMPCILGSDGAGEYDGQAVVLYPALGWGDQAVVQGRDFRVLGMPDDGTFAEQILIPPENMYPKPAHLSWEQAAALPLAGLTAWRALFTRCQLQVGERVLITGIGGGVALVALQLALAAGAEVWVTSGSAEKIDKALSLGAQGGANYRSAGWDKQLKTEAGGFDVILDSAAGDGFAALPGLCNPGARIGIYGGTLGKMNGISPQLIFWKQISLLGSTMGTRAEFAAMLDFVALHRIVPVVDTVFPLAEGNAALMRLAEGEQFGKIVLQV
ncbi:MAG: zinc-binding dehydrogenase [Saprospiraceae bacterium]|nr:zinc-binding dehydrogenase [Saprospiraceae bacterium]